MLDFADPQVAGYVPVPGGRIWYRVNGLGRPGAPLVCITGGPGLAHHYFLPMLRFAADRPVILYDQLDTGNADRPGDTANWTLEHYVNELEALRTALGYDQVIPVGHSWGGLLAYEYALAYPASCAAAVLWSPCLSASRWIKDTRELIAELPAYARRLIEECEARGDYEDPGYTHANEIFSRRHVRRVDPRPPELMRAFSGFAEKLYVYMWGPSEFTPTGVFKTYEGLERIGELKLPVLFLCGEHDEARPNTLREFAGMIPGAELAVIDGASHLTLSEAPEPTLAAVGDFLKRRAC